MLADTGSTVVLLQHIYTQLRNVYCVPAEIPCMKELQLLIEEMQQEGDEIFTCKYCGAPTKYAPEDQSPPADYCHESDHGLTEGSEQTS